MSLKLHDTGADVLADGRRMVPSAARNAAPILQVLQQDAPKTGRMLEIAAGSGLHTAAFSAALPGLNWQPTDVEAANFASIAAWSATSSGTILPPVQLDASRPGWSAQWPGQNAVLLVNLLHLISAPAAATVLTEIAAVLAPAGTAFLYGPFLRNGKPTSPGDAAFDESLRAHDPTIGYKDLAWVTGLLEAAGLQVSLREMPANNLMLIARRR